MDKIEKQVSDYYTDKVQQFGATSKGVDWNGPESHFLRFEQLTKIINEPAFSLLDFGCGYGALIEFLQKKYPNSFSYTGYDISEAMIMEARKKFNSKDYFFTADFASIKPVDYSIASGIFNIRLENKEEEWKQYIIETLHKMDALSSKGFSFNLLTSFSDKEYMRDYLFYADPAWIFNYCRKNFSKYVALLHDYPLYEFTVLIRKF